MLSALAPFGGRFGGDLAPLMRDAFAKAASAAPRIAIDMHETDAGLDITADVAGARKEDVNLSVEDGNVYITVTRPEAVREQGDANSRVWLRERSSGSASRTLRVGAAFDAKKLTVEGYADGVLRLRVPRAAGAEQRRRIAL